MRVIIGVFIRRHFHEFISKSTKGAILCIHDYDNNGEWWLPVG
jgi:hypothetical protein